MNAEQTGTLLSEKRKVSAESLRKAFIQHAVIGTVLALLLRILEVPIIFAILFSSTLMLSYFYIFKKGGEPHALIDTFSDSVYYLGFILTLVSLIVSMTFFKMDDGAVSASYILVQFGAAMTTTMLGMIFRIYYKQFDMTIESAQNSAKESLNDTVSMFNIQMRSANTTLSKLSEVMNKSIKHAEERNLKSFEIYENTQKKVIALGEDSLKEFSKKLNGMINKSFEAIEKRTTASLTSMTGEFQKNLKVNAENHEINNKNISTHFDSLSKEMIRELTSSISPLSASSNELSQVFNKTKKSSAKLDDTITKVTADLALLDSMTPVMTKINESKEYFVKNLDGLSQLISSSVESATSVDKRLKRNTVEISKEYKELLSQFKELTTTFNITNILEEEGKLLSIIQDRGKGLQELSKQWAVDTEAMSQNSKLFTENLIETSKFITTELQQTTPKLMIKTNDEK
jgi:hypothetical protein